MRIAFIGHSYHRRTLSNQFFLRCLESLGTVELFFDDSWQNESAEWVKTFDSSRFDAIVIWQAWKPFDYIRFPHPNVTFVPMYDAHAGAQFYWESRFNQAKILCFSDALRRQVAQHTTRLHCVKYYPDPKAYPPARQDYSLRGIFWSRVAAIDLNMIASLSGPAVFDRFTVHDAPDPFSGAVTPWPDSPVKARTQCRTQWSELGEDYRRLLPEHNVFFAPRLYEGIGLSLLEAMATGLCVVAPNTPTHNEYIESGVNGLLYDASKPAPLNLDRVCEMGARARQTVETGHEAWLRARPILLDFLLASTGSLGASSGE